MQVNRRILYTSALSTGSTGPFGSGVGDWQSFIIWGSVARAYSLAVAATGTRKAFRVVDSGGLNPQDILVLTTGFTDVASLNTWIGAHGTASVTTLYDQVGTNDWTQATVSKMPTILVNGINGMPSMSFVAANFQTLISGTGLTQGIPFSIEAVAKRTGTIASANIISDKVVDIEFNFNAADTAGIYAGAGSGLNDTALDNAAHVIQGTYDAGTAGTINVDGRTQQTGTTGTNVFNGAPHQVCLGSYQDATQYLNGLISEAGIYGTTYSAGVQSNARTAYGL